MNRLQPGDGDTAAAAFKLSLEALRGMTGVVVAARRSRCRPGVRVGQPFVSGTSPAAEVTSDMLNALEAGTAIPPDPALENALQACGFSTAPGEPGRGLLALLRTLREHGHELDHIDRLFGS